MHIFSPGRVNLIGEHTDYNDGFVLPMAIERGTIIQATRRDDDHLLIHAKKFGQHDEAELSNLNAPNATEWRAYTRGTAQALLDKGLTLHGANITIDSDLPLGGGLSSSASLEVGIATALLRLANIELPATEIARIAQRAEIEYAHVNCGIMDQLAVAAGVVGHATLIDCRSLAIENVPIPNEVAIVIVDSGVPRTLAGSAYNQRRAECEQAVQALQAIDPSIRSLRDATSDQILEVMLNDAVTETVLKRARHVVSENERVLNAVEALKSGDYAYLGELMNESHYSLRDDYEVSSQELDTLTDLLREMDGVYGARLTGAGFGGCCVALVDADKADAVVAAIKPAYDQATGRTSEAFSTKASGIRVEE